MEKYRRREGTQRIESRRSLTWIELHDGGRRRRGSLLQQADEEKEEEEDGDERKGKTLAKKRNI